jgi:predicted DNA-binding WGR domain protein
MIGKKIKNPKKSSSKETRIKQLSDYILNPGLAESSEKCIYHGSRNFISETSSGQIKEMLVLATDAVRSVDPINHYVLSWRTGEKPTNEEVEKVVDMFLDELNVRDHQVIFGLHADTDNYHLHLELNRVHPYTEKCVEINKGFDIKSVHQAITKIEAAFGWQPEKNAIYEIDRNGKIKERINHKDKQRKPRQEKIDKELRTGIKSAEKIAIEEAAPIISASKSWSQLHADLAAIGMRYVKVENGAVIFVGNVAVKASSVDREASFGKMEKRIGAYVGGSYELTGSQHFDNRNKQKPIDQEDLVLIIKKANTWSQLHDNLANIGVIYLKKGSGAVIIKDGIAEKASKISRDISLSNLQRRLGPYQDGNIEKNEQPLDHDKQPLFRDYLKEKEAYLEIVAKEKHEMKRLLDEEYNAMLKKQKKRREEILVGSWKRRGIQLNAVRSVVSFEQAKEKAALKEKQKIEREKLKRRYRSFPNYNQWLSNFDIPVITGTDFVASASTDIGSFLPKIIGNDVDYVKKGTSSVAFRDKGNKVFIYKYDDEASVLAALQLSEQKWGTFRIDSNDKKFQSICVKLAAEHGFKIQNTELQDMIKVEKDKLNKVDNYSSVSQSFNRNSPPGGMSM